MEQYVLFQVTIDSVKAAMQVGLVNLAANVDTDGRRRPHHGFLAHPNLRLTVGDAGP